MVFPVKLQSLRRTAEKQKPDKHCSQQTVGYNKLTAATSGG